MRAGIGARISLVKVQLPLTLDIAIGNDWSKHCFNGQLVTSALGGRVYIYIDTIFTDQAEFDIFSWDGLTYTWPGKGDGAKFWSICFGVKGQNKEYVPEPGEDEFYTKCGLELYPDSGYSGTKITPNFAPTTEVGGVLYQNGKSYFGAYSMKMKGQCSRAVVFDFDSGFDASNPEATASSLRFDAYWSQSSFPYDLYNDVGAVKVYAKPKAQVKPPAALAMKCGITIFSDKWYQGTKTVFTAESPTGYFIKSTKWSGGIYSFKVDGHCDKVVVHSNNDGGSACKIRHKENAMWQTGTDQTNTDKFGCGDMSDTKPTKGKDAVYGSYVCGITVFSKTASNHQSVYCPNRKEVSFPIVKGQQYHTDSSIATASTFCMRQAFEETTRSGSQGDGSYYEKRLTSPVVQNGRIDMQESPDDVTNAGKQCTSDSYCGGGTCTCSQDANGKCLDKQTCKSTPVVPTGDGIAKCSQCEDACPEGSTSVEVEKVSITSTGTADICGATAAILRCPATVSSKYSCCVTDYRVWSCSAGD